MKKSYVGFSGLYTFSYMALGVLTPMIGQYLDYIGFSGAQIGTITAAGTCMAVIASAVWGRLYDGSSNKYRLILALCLAAGMIGLLLLKVSWYPFFLVAYSVLYFFQAPVMAFSDSLTLEEQLPFSKIRKFGAVGFALGVFAAGILAQYTSISIIFYLYSASFLLSAILLFSMSRGNSSAQSRKEAGKKASYRLLLQDRRLIQLLLCIFFVGGTNVANNTYFSFLYLEAGGSLAGVGIVMLLMVGSEAPFMQWSAGLAQKFTLEKTIAGAVLISVMRFLLYALAPPFFLIAALFFLQGAVNGIILVEFVRYVRKLAPKGCEGLAVSIYYALGSSGSTIVCQIIGGALLDGFGPEGVYLFFALFNLVGLVLYVTFGLYKEKM